MDRPERWVPVTRFNGLYEVSDLGRVRGLDRVVTRSNGKPITIQGRVLRPQLHAHGYLMVTLRPGDGSAGSRTIHSLVMAAFGPPQPPGTEILHGPGGITDNRPANLRWGTRSENMIDCHRDGTMLHAKLSIPVVRHCRVRYAAGETAADLAREHGVDRTVMWRAVTGRSWKHAH